MLIINPGSGPVADSGTGWENSEAGARAQAEGWLARMTNEGHRVDLLDGATPVEDCRWDRKAGPDGRGGIVGTGEFTGRWQFTFRHQVTGVECRLETHGISDIAAWEADAKAEGRLRIHPRVYWNGSSCSTPELSDWSAPGFRPVLTFEAVQ